ncbi:hypothetical protein QUF63_03510 [Anaerolineales bacterium HSG25]|nr:hypothetical protein [Anaerolineales bacterium HSG25]
MRKIPKQKIAYSGILFLASIVFLMFQTQLLAQERIELTILGSHQDKALYSSDTIDFLITGQELEDLEYTWDSDLGEPIFVDKEEGYDAIFSHTIPKEVTSSYTITVTGWYRNQLIDSDSVTIPIAVPTFTPTPSRTLTPSPTSSRTHTPSPTPTATPRTIATMNLYAHGSLIPITQTQYIITNTNQTTIPLNVDAFDLKGTPILTKNLSCLWQNVEQPNDCLTVFQIGTGTPDVSVMVSGQNKNITGSVTQSVRIVTPTPTPIPTATPRTIATINLYAHGSLIPITQTQYIITKTNQTTIPLSVEAFDLKGTSILTENLSCRWQNVEQPNDCLTVFHIGTGTPDVSVMVSGRKKNITGSVTQSVTILTPTLTATNIPEPTFTPKPTNTPTPTLTPTYPPITLLSPTENENLTGATTFSWQWDGQLAENQAFEIGLWDNDKYRAVHDAFDHKKHYITPQANEYKTVINIDQLKEFSCGTSGYFWSVRVLRCSQLDHEQLCRNQQITEVFSSEQQSVKGVCPSSGGDDEKKNGDNVEPVPTLPK